MEPDRPVYGTRRVLFISVVRTTPNLQGTIDVLRYSRVEGDRVWTDVKVHLIESTLLDKDSVELSPEKRTIFK